MSNTKATYLRFWKSMTERFGSQWITKHGNAPTQEWITLLDKFTPQTIADAMGLMSSRPERERAFPPSHAEFEALLGKASRSAKSADTKDFLRGYWIRVVHETCMRHAALCKLVPWGEKSYAALPDDVRPIAIRKSQELVNYAVDAEMKTGQRTSGIEQHVNADLWNTLKLYRRDEAPTLQKTA